EDRQGGSVLPAEARPRIGSYRQPGYFDDAVKQPFGRFARAASKTATDAGAGDGDASAAPGKDTGSPATLSPVHLARLTPSASAVGGGLTNSSNDSTRSNSPAMNGNIQLAASTSNPDYAAKTLGYDRNTFEEMLHVFKPFYGLSPSDNVIFHDNGDVYFDGDLIGNIHDFPP